MSTRMLRLLAASGLTVLALTGCPGPANTNNNPDDGGTPTEQTCFQDPADSNTEIINSCPPAGVTQVEKNPVLPLVNGALPPLP